MRQFRFISSIGRCVLPLLFLMLNVQLLTGQQSLNFTEGNVNYRNALDLYEKEKFVAAQEYFRKGIEEINDVHSEIRIEAEFYHALCAVELFHANAEALLLSFIDNNTDSPHLLEAYFNLAKFQFRKKKYRDVLDYLARIDPLDLSKENRSEYYFKKGYSEFQLDQQDNSAQSFYEIKDTDNPYVMAARYYYAHISYLAGNYQTALNNFNKIKNDPLFGPLVPYYLTQIFYLQNKYDTLLAYAPAVLDSAPPKREDEIRKLIGDAYYETGNYEKAISYLEAYMKKTTTGQSEYYQLGYSYFMAKDYQNAISKLQKAVGENDTLSQSAYYYIGRASIINDDKKAARSAFKNAHELNIDQEIAEDALFNYAKTAYELSYHPYDDAILAFEEYINAYPNSKQLDDAYEYLVGVYYTTKNYKEALKSIERIKSDDIKLLHAKQRLAYYRGVELYNEKKYDDAAEHFHLSLKHPYDPSLKASSKFWLAQSYFQLKDYDNADNFYSEFLASSGARSLAYYEKAYYHLAYNFYERKKYSGAVFWYREFIDKAKQADKGLITDAYLRTGDCYFIQKDYRNAKAYYDQASKLGTFDTDYALLQSAISNGVLGDYELKIEKLKELVGSGTNSVYMDDALFELGKTYLILDEEGQALSFFNQLVNDHTESNYMAESYLKIGLIHYNRKEDDMALNAFNTVVKKFDDRGLSKEALDKIRKIYIDKGDAQAFQDYVNGVPFADITKSELDSTSYVIAENSYLDGDCEKATRDFTNYLKQYPKGIFKLNAHYYRADCEARAGFYQEATKDFSYVSSIARNKFSEKSAANLIWLYKKLDQPDNVILAARKLMDLASRKENVQLAELSLMQMYFQKEKYDTAAVFAEGILSKGTYEEKVEQEALMILSKSKLEEENYVEAIKHLDTLSKYSNEMGAEAKYLLAKTYYLQGEYGKSDTIAYQLVNQIPSFPYWIAKGFILLADNFIAKEDFYNARLTFESVIDNADDSELIDIAKEKLDLLNRVEQERQQQAQDTLEVEFNFQEPSDQKLFEADSLKIETDTINQAIERIDESNE